MLFWWAVLGSVVQAVVTWYWPIKVAIRIHQTGWRAILEVQVNTGLLNPRLELDISDKVAMALEHILKRWRATGEPVQVPLQKTIRRMPRRKLLGILKEPTQYLARRVRCSKLAIAAEVGSIDAMEAALLSGAVWAVVGSVVGIVSRAIQLRDTRPELQVVPNYGGPAWRLETDCILHLRTGHAIVAGIWLLRRVLRDKEVRAWARDSWRRKGVEGSGRASDPRADEDGHGEP